MWKVTYPSIDGLRNSEHLDLTVCQTVPIKEHQLGYKYSEDFFELTQFRVSI